MMAVCHGVKQGPCYRIATITSPITFFSIFAKPVTQQLYQAFAGISQV